jgi:hypothetical protein
MPTRRHTLAFALLLAFVSFAAAGQSRVQWVPVGTAGATGNSSKGIAFTFAWFKSTHSPGETAILVCEYLPQNVQSTDPLPAPPRCAKTVVPATGLTSIGVTASPWFDSPVAVSSVWFFDGTGIVVCQTFGGGGTPVCTKKGALETGF